MSAVKLHLFGKTKVLIVEDNFALRKVLSDHLLGEGYEILAADNGLRGYELALADHPDLILLDMMLPEMDGMTVLRSLRKDEWGATVKIFIMTNLMQGNALTKELEPYNVTGFIEKVNLTLEDLSKKIELAFEKK